MDILVPSFPKNDQPSQMLIEDIIDNPPLGAKVFFGEVMDKFQEDRLIDYVLTPRVIDSSGYSSFKTRTFFIGFNLRRILIPDSVAGVYYQNFNVGQKSFWGYYDVFLRRSPLFRKQMGRIGIEIDDEDGKGNSKGASCWSAYYKNGSHIMLPAPSFLTDAKNQASIRLNDLGIDEWTKIDSNSTGIDDQLLGRCTRESFNQDHPFWCNHHLFLATAEDMSHPAAERYRQYKAEVDKGNPDYSIISFNYKDISELKSWSGQTFKKALRETKVLRDMKAKHTKSKFLQEGLGIWSYNGRGWYSTEFLDMCVDLGRKRHLLPITRRSQDPKCADENVRYFMGVDPSKGDLKKSDDGALVVLRAEPLFKDAGDNISDWRLDFVWAFKVKGADVSQWSGLIHQKEKHFNFTGICMDHGGGGNWIKPELAKEKQIINDVQIKCLPIVTEDDTTVNNGNYCLVMFTNHDDSIKRKWDSLKGADNLIDCAHSELKDAIEHVCIGFPPPFAEISIDEKNKWDDERVWASKLLDLTRSQLSKISVLTKEDGTFIFTKNNAHVFNTKGKKDDFAYAAVHAYTRFLIWIKFGGKDYDLPEDERCGGD